MNDVNHWDEGLDNVSDDDDIVNDIEVVLAPNFHSDFPHEVLGCSSGALPEQLDRAYRDLARKYHPDNKQHSSSDDPQITSRNRLIFQRISEAHARATGKEQVPRTQEDAKQAYENMFGKYREQYYNEGGLIGIPYACDLKEALEKTRYYRDVLSLSLCRFGDTTLRATFFRTWLIKKEMNLWLWMAEIVLTWFVIVFCVLALLLREDPNIWPFMSNNDGHIIDIAGGVALMFAQFILCFWYGFCRYPVGDEFVLQWLCPSNEERSRRAFLLERDMDDIRDVCSFYLHGDDLKRFNQGVLWICFPVVLPQLMVSSVTSLFARLCCCCCNRDEDVMSCGRHLSKTVAGLIVVMGYYVLWMYGNIYCKLAGSISLLLSQNLYNAVLFQKSPFEFVQSFFVGNICLFTFQNDEKKLHEREQACSDDESNRRYGHKRVIGTLEEAAPDIEADPTSEDNEDDDNDQSNSLQLQRCCESVQHSKKNGEDVAAMVTPTTAARSDTITPADNSSLISPVKSRSFASFNPLTVLKSTKFPKRRKTASTPATLRESYKNDNDEENISFDLSYIDKGKIETYMGTRQETNPRDDSLSAGEILQDLAEGDDEDDSQHIDATDDLEPNQLLAAYKATKRRIEEAFYSSTRIHVVQQHGSDGSNDKAPDLSEENLPIPSRIRTGDRCDLNAVTNGDDDLKVRPPAMLRVLEDDTDDENKNDQEVEVDNKGIVFGEAPKSGQSTRSSSKSRLGSLRRFGRRSMFGGENEKQVDEHAGPPLKHILTNNRTEHSKIHDVELTSKSTWDSLIAHSISEMERRPGEDSKHVSLQLENDTCSI